MGQVIGFRKARLTGFIPPELGQDAPEAAHRRAKADADDLIAHAKSGAVGPPEPEEPPPVCA